MVFFLKHLDYIYFFYGLSFLLLAGVCFLLYKSNSKPIPWSLLSLFGIFQGFIEWISMMELSTGDFPFFDYMGISILLLSFVFLFEFGRNGFRAIYPKAFGGLSVIWQYGILLIAVFALHSLGVDDFDTSTRYVFGFFGGILSAALLFHYYLSETKCRYYFLVSSICLSLYAVTAGLVVNKGAFFLCHYLNTDNFQLYAGFPVQILRVALVITLAVSLWEYYCFMRKVQYNSLVDLSFGYGKWLTTAIIAVLCCGWLLTMIISNSVDRNQKDDFRITAEAIAAGISMENLNKLNGSMADLKTADYKIIQRYLREFEGSVKEIKWFYLMKIRDGKLYFILDSTPENSPDFTPPGTTYADAPRDLYGVFKNGKPLVCGPYSDRWGSFISAFIPIMDPGTRTVYAVLGCDINSARWSQMISLSRLQPIIITLLICIILVIGFLMHQSSIETAVIISESERKYRNLFNNSNDSILILDLKGRFIEVNEVACGKLGYSCEEFVKLSFRDIESAGSGYFTSERMSQLSRDAQFVFETSLLSQDKISVPVEINAKLIDYMGSECVLCIARDLSERKKIESVLRDSESRYTQLFNEMLSGFALHEIICDENGYPCDYRFLEINAAFEKLTGLTRERVIGKTILEVLPETEHEWISRFGDVALTGKPVFSESYHHGLGKYFEIRAFSSEKGKFAVIFNDITDRKQEEENLKYERSIISVLNQSSSVKDAGREILDILCGIEGVDSGGVYNVDKISGCIELVAHRGLGDDFVKEVSRYSGDSSPAKLLKEGKLVFTSYDKLIFTAAKQTGVTEKIQAVAIIPLINENQAIAAINLCSHTEAEFSPLVQRKITEITEKIAAAFLKLKITEELNKADRFNREIVKDVTRHKELQNRLDQSQKMESIGRFAGGIAHDFNNVIQVINGFSELIMMKIGGNSEIKEELEEISKAGKRAMEITNQLLLCSKRKPANIIDVDMNKLISSLNFTVLCGLGENIILETVLFPGLSHAKGDSKQLEQVLLNLALNARDWMPNGGKLKIMTSNIHLEDKDLTSGCEGEAGDFIRISVSDTGAGMNPEEKSQIFEPFFSTNPRSKGAGMGLAIVYGIVKQHKGWVNVYSEKGSGATFEIHIPAKTN